ncbi:YhcN/YlaJ family sporulation lipoprotein [Alkalihalobacillus sp. AL-G]|uniref:YhcN/YlaJ family sporulation lipoprotein n=1 Tax=Alkalihalobacillus sp. AL-G TaxID=2926399 RepID=UPI00272BC99A|nr:YhcN/YlaJ family sporulation lipoprotein [Alkalihalobacillus sp. AL-G]WLD94747.1 YhcN/YlaJ family sporulation lipoprotein [Alkalihalobacillus sp. AL-G]
MKGNWIKKQTKLFVLSGVLLLPLVACNANGGDNGDAGNGVETQDLNNVNENDNGLIDENGNGNNNANGTNNGNGNDRYEVADDAAKKVADLPEVSDANVLVTDENAYVAAQLRNNEGGEGEITREIKRKISEQVKAVDRDINNVYVSANPDFVDRVNDYVTRVGQGEPVEGFGEEFGEMIQRIFPNVE